MRLWRLLLRWLGVGRRRHKEVFEQIVAPANMAAALARVQRRARENAREDQELRRFLVKPQENLEAMRRELIRGRYRPRPAQRVAIPKSDAGVRRIALLSVRDRIAQTAANQVLMPLLDAEFADASFGYRPNRSLADALERVCECRRKGLRWVVHGDIESCFERIRHDRLLDRLADSIADRRLLRLVRLWLAGFAYGPRGLPQGAPLSPLLCNLALDPVDQGIADGSAQLVRFADDLVILCRSRADAEAARGRAARLLNRQGLRLNPSKTRVTSFSEGFFFLGHYFVHDLMLRDATVGAVEEVKRRAERAAQRKQRRGIWRWLAGRA